MKHKILIAPDKFKGSLSSFEVCNCLRRGIETVLPNSTFELCPLADGGEGSLEVLTSYLNLVKRDCDTVDPLGRRIEASYYISGRIAYIELASASGLALLNKPERNPMHTGTLGTGLQIKHAIENGAEQIYLFLGGSATNDGGIGIASALGYEFFDENGDILSPIGSSLKAITAVGPPKDPVNIKKIVLCCDVKNIPFGEYGAAQIFAKQKGANDREIIELDEGLSNLCKVVQKKSNIDLSQLVGGGAAGGVAVSLLCFFNAEIESGIALISDISNLEAKIANADLVITGEGSLDNQSLEGKVVSGVANSCKKLKKPLWAVVGKNDLSTQEINNLGIEKLFSILDLAHDLEDAIGNAMKYLFVIGERIGRELKTRN